MKITKSQLRKMIRYELNENIRSVSNSDADKFIESVLKLGSRDNIFDKFMRTNKISSDQLSKLVELVARRILERWV